MQNFFPNLLLAFFVLALYFFIHVFNSRKLKYSENRLLCLFCLSSAIWSFGFRGIFVQTDPQAAYLWRAIGMVGTITYLIVAQMLVCYVSGVDKRVRNFMNSIAFLGVFVYFLNIQKDQVIYELSDIGMTYHFKSGWINTIYTLYTVWVALNMLILVLHMIFRGEKRRVRILGRKLFGAESVIIFGMLLDTIFPLIGKNAIPGSTIAQFLGMIIMYHAIIFVDHSRINITNMSEYIYYSLSIPVLVYDSAHELQILNDAAFSFFSVEKGNTEDLNISCLFPITEREVFAFIGRQKEVESVCCNNDLYCRLSINKIFDDYDDIIGYIILITDLSEYKKALHKMEEARQEAEAANQAKSTFLANMSHEIRTPMNAIIGFSELLLNMDLEEKVRENIEDIKLSSHNLLAIINDILDISKIESGKTELICDNYYLTALLRDISLIITMQAKEKGLDFRMEVDKNLPNILYGDKVRIRGVLINVLNNAVKYTKEGSVTLQAGFQEEPDDYVILEFRIIDTGSGIHKEDQARLFNSFERLDRRVHYGIEGSGLGLAIARGYVNLMGGDIQVQSVYGKGSTFTITLKQKVVDRSPMDGSYSHDTDENKFGRMRISGVRVLAVDDNQINVKVAQGILGTYGLTVDTAGSGREAIRLCEKEDYQLIFMDEMMPEMNGVEAMNEIRKLRDYYAADGECRIIVLTADAISGARTRLIREGFDEYLGKPMNLKQLERLFIRFLPAEKIFWETEEEQEKKEDAEEKEEASDIGYLKEVLKHADVEKGVTNCGGRTEDYRKVLKITSEYGEKQLAELERMQEEKDYANYTIKIHSLKSSSMNLGAVRISEMARQQEMAGEQGDYAFIEEHAEEFRVEYRKLLDEVEEVLAHYTEQEEAGEKEKLGEEMILLILSNIRNALEEFQYPKIFDMLEEIKQYDMPEKYKRVFDQISDWMEDLSVEKIEELLEKTLQ